MTPRLAVGRVQSAGYHALLVEQLTRLTIAIENLNATITNEGKRGGVVDRLAMSLVGVRDAINRSANFR